MCAVSAIGDMFDQRWKPKFPTFPHDPYSPIPYSPYSPTDPTDWEKELQKLQPKPAPVPQISKEEFEQLKLELESLRNLIKAAKIYDEVAMQPGCELESKIAFIKQAAKLVGVDFDGVFEPKMKKAATKKK